VADQFRRERRPHVSGVGEAVQHDDRGPRAANSRVNGGAIGLDLFDAHAGGKGPNHELNSKR
jgi:hypothetical protein